MVIVIVVGGFFIFYINNETRFSSRLGVEMLHQKK
jgi:hypothetical protein